MERFITGLASFFVALVLSIPVGLFGGMVLADMWGWFITPVFTDLPTLTTLQAWGIILVFSYMRTSVYTSMIYSKLTKVHPEDSDIYDAITVQLVSAVTILFIWAFSYFIKSVVM